MTYAIVKSGGKQYRVEEGQSLLVERLAADVGATVPLQPLLFRGDDDALESKPRRRGRRGGRRRSAAKAESTASE